MANGEVVHLQEASQPASPDIPLAEGQKAHALPLGTTQRRKTLTTLRTCTASVKHLLHPWQTCLHLPSKDTNCVPYPKSSWRTPSSGSAASSPCLQVLLPQQSTQAPNCKRAKAALTKQEKSREKDVGALTFVQTVVVSFVRGMEHGDQTLPINDLFVYFPVQLVPALVTAMEQQRFASVEVKGGCGNRLWKQGEEDNGGGSLQQGNYTRPPPPHAGHVMAARAFTWRH